MSLHWGYSRVEPNFIHNLKPIVAIQSYQIFATSFNLIYDGCHDDRWRFFEPAKDY